MSIAAALLLLGACGSASRTMVVEPSIEQIVLQVVVGGVKDVVRSVDRTKPAGCLEGFAGVSETIALRIDGQPRTGVLAWIAAAHRVAGYVVSGDNRNAGSVEYAYALRVRGFNVWRSTRISDGRVSLVTDVWGRIGPRGELYHVRLVLDGIDLGDGTRLRGTATGWSRIGDRCRLVERFASREIRKAMLEALYEIQRGGTGLYHAGSAESVIEAIGTRDR